MDKDNLYVPSALAAGTLGPAPGAFIFFHNSLIAEGKPATAGQGWERLKRFRLLLTNGYPTFSRERVAALHEHGSKLFFYIWFNGFYAKETRKPKPDGDWRHEVLEQHPEWLLNPDRPEQGGGAVQPAYFFDLTEPELRSFLSRVIAGHRRRTGYDGVFFDYAGRYALPESVAALHDRRHPDTPYDAAGAEFLRTPKAADPGCLIFTNQAYRAARYLLPPSDIDVTESIGTSFVWGREISLYAEGEGWISTRETFYRPWAGETGIQRYYGDMVAKVRRHNPELTFVAIDYVNAAWEATGGTAQHEGRAVPVYRRRTDRAAIFYGCAAARLFGLSSYSSDWYALGYYDDEPFLLDLGRPLEDAPEERDEVVLRYYENGFVALMTGERAGEFDAASPHIPEGVRAIRDLFAGRSLPATHRQCLITIEPAISPVSGARYPAGRVYRYER
ncbi:MAG: hypothetical protein EXS64_02130 [Candidatus Latescibacteria bacterium]|nr:hypothetical protein [Candidatus Latescibacterota bacterium]